MRLRGPKYGNQKTDGSASRRESKRLQELQLLEKAGKIFHLRTQVTFELIPPQYEEGKMVERAAKYVADAVYYDKAVSETHAALRAAYGMVVEDSKGFRTPTYILKRKLMMHVHGIRIREV